MIAVDTRIQQIIDLLRQGDFHQSTEYYHSQSDQFSSEIKQWFDSWYGLCLLSEQSDSLQCVFPNKAVVDDYPTAKQALDAYCQNQAATEIQQLLRKLSYDSPYKDFRLIMSTLLDIDNTPECLHKLDSIAQSSPYHQIAKLIDLAVGGSTAMSDPAAFNSETQQFIAALGNHNTQPDQQPFAEGSTAQHKFEWLMKHSVADHPTNVQSMLLSLLVDYPLGVDAYQARFGALTEFELLRLQALASERDGDWGSAAQYWNDCLHAIDFQQDNQAEAIRHLIEQRANQCSDQCGYDNPQHQLSILEQRFQKNPDDSETCLKLLTNYRTSGDDQGYKQLLKQAITQFPQHPAIIAAAVEHASDTVEFEDAARLASNLLEHDALNQNARRLLIQSYLRYADKLALRGQVNSSTTILDQTEALERPKPSGLVSLHRALMHYVTGEEFKAEQAVEIGCTQLGSYLYAYVQMAAETARLGFKKKYTKQYLKLIRSLAGYQPDAEEIVELMQLLSDYTSDARIDSNELLSVVRPFVHQSLEGEYSHDQLRLICTILENINAYEDLHQVAQNASQRNDQANAEFEYYRIVGITQGNPAQINADDSLVLEQLLDRLTDQNPQLRLRITEFLNANLLTGSTILDTDAEHSMMPTSQNNTDMSIGGILTTFKRLFNQ